MEILLLEIYQILFFMSNLTVFYVVFLFFKKLLNVMKSDSIKTEPFKLNGTVFLLFWISLAIILSYLIN
jgi:hypothetical protein